MTIHNTHVTVNDIISDIIKIISLIHIITQAQRNSHNYASAAIRLAMAWSSIAQCRSVFLGAEVSYGHFITSADMS